MNKIKLVLILMLCAFSSVPGFAQVNCSSYNITCLSPATRNVDVGHDWKMTHGYSFTTTNNAPVNATGGSLLLRSSLGTGNGFYTCYNFAAYNTYKVCFWVRNVSGWPGNYYGRLYVYAADIAPSQLIPLGATMPSGINKYLISDSYQGPGNGDMDQTTGTSEWKFMSITFTPTMPANSLCFYANNPAGPAPAGPNAYNTEYQLEVDDIRVEPAPSSPNITITQSPANPVAGCNAPITLTVNGMPANTIAKWKTPGVTLNNATGSNVTVSACSTTTYEVEIIHPGAVEPPCATCLNQKLTHTVQIDQWAEASRIIYPTNLINCMTQYTLSYDDPGTCPDMSNNANYTWIKPDGTTAGTGKTITPTAGVYHNGEWTLRIKHNNKNCEEELKFTLAVGSCCQSNPNFSFTPNANPVTFTNTGSGIMNHISTLWSFGDGTTSYVANPVHTYNVTAPTQFTVCQTTLFEDDLGVGCCNRICKTIQVNPPVNACTAVANFTYNYLPGAPANNIKFTNTSSGNGTICDAIWDFGDGPPPITSSLPNVTHVMATPGPWNVCVTAKNCIYDPNSGALINSCFSTKKCQIVPPPQTRMGKPGTTTEYYGNDNSIPDMTVASNKQLTIYPNPTNGDFTVTLQGITGSYHVIVRDKLTRKVYDTEHTFNHAPVNISLNDVANGVYSVEVRNEKEQFVQQISIVK